MTKSTIPAVAALSLAVLPLQAADLQDPRTRDESLAATTVSVETRRLESGIYEYVYTVSSPVENKGTIDLFMVDISCDIDFGEVVFPEAPEPLFQGDYSLQPHVPVQLYFAPVYSAGMEITADAEAAWALTMEPGGSDTGYRILSPAPPGLRTFTLKPSWATNEYDYSSLTDEEIETVPWVDTFTVTGLVEGPACATAPDPTPDLYPGSGAEGDVVNALLAYEQPTRDQWITSDESITLHVHYSDTLDPASFRVQPGWARRFFSPIAGGEDIVELPLQNGMNVFHLDATATRSKGPRKADEDHHSRHDRDTFRVRFEMPVETAGGKDR